MSDPRRLIDDSDSRLLSQLLTAGRLEEPSPELIERFARSAALGLATSAAMQGVVSPAAALAPAASAGNVVPLAASASAPAVVGAVVPASVGGASGAAAAGWAASGALAKGALGSAGLLKSGAAGAVLAKWLGVGIVGLTAASATPKVLHWVEQREGAAPAAMTSPRAAPSASQAARPPAVTSPAVTSPAVTSPAVTSPGARAEAAARVARSPEARLPEDATRDVVAPKAAASRATWPERRAIGIERPARAPSPRAAAVPSSVDAAAPGRVVRAAPRTSAAPAPEQEPASPATIAAGLPRPAQPTNEGPSPAGSAATRTGASATSAVMSAAGSAPASAPTSRPALRTLGAELARLDRARAALVRGDARGALHELDGYERAFPARQLGLEASMLRMEAHLRRGELIRAREIARRILARPVPPPHARRAREVLEGAASSP
jgi:hypothetical protein